MIFIILFTRDVFGYPQFIGKGYHNCLTCHYNPFGNGPLNDYGRGVAASGLAGRLLIPKSVTDEKLSNISGFFFNKQDKQFIKPSFDYRGGNVYSGLETEESQENWFNMQMDASLSAVFGKRKEFVTTFTLSVVPGNTVRGNKAEYEVLEGEDLIFSREHYFGMKYRKDLSFYIGKMDKPFGIRTSNHETYARKRTGNDQYSSTHGALVHFYKEKFDLGVQLYLGDFEKIEEVRRQGLSTKFEYSINDKFRPGISFLTESDETDEYMAYSAHSKLRVGKGSSIMFEFGRTNKTPETGDQTSEQFLFLQNHFYINRGLYFVTTYETWTPDTGVEKTNHRFGPGLLYFPMQRIELNLDLFSIKEYALDSTVKDQWSLIGQVHIWL